MKFSFSRIFRVLFYFFVFIVLLSNSFRYLDNDFGWHLKMGEEIVESKSVPRVNHNNNTINNVEWVDHEWLMDAGLFIAYEHIGYIGINIFFALLVLITLILLHGFTEKYYLEKWREKDYYPKGGGIIFVMLLLGLFVMAPHIGVRIQEIALLNLVLLFIIIKNFEEQGDIKILFFLPALFLFWACAHGSFPIGLALLFIWLSVKTAELILKKTKYARYFHLNNVVARKKILLFLLFSAAALAATLLTPYGAKLYSFLAGYKNTFYLTHIEEWLPFYCYPVSFSQLFYAALVVIFILFTFFSMFEKQKGEYHKINLWHLALACLFLAMALKSRRHFPLLFVATFPFVIEFFTIYLRFRLNAPLDNIIACVAKASLITGLITLSVAMFISINFIKNPFISFCENYPCSAVDFLKNSEYKNSLIFNSYGWGGFLIWVWPEKQLFIDGRLPQYEFAGHTLLEEYYEFLKKDGVADKLKQYNIQIVLLPKEKPINLKWYNKLLFHITNEEVNKKSDLIGYLNNNWLLAYEDETSYVFSHR